MMEQREQRAFTDNQHEVHKEAAGNFPISCATNEDIGISVFFIYMTAMTRYTPSLPLVLTLSETSALSQHPP